jgi:hypothetical protein
MSQVSALQRQRVDRPEERSFACAPPRALMWRWLDLRADNVTPTSDALWASVCVFCAFLILGFIDMQLSPTGVPLMIGSYGALTFYAPVLAISRCSPLGTHSALGS